MLNPVNHCVHYSIINRVFDDRLLLSYLYYNQFRFKILIKRHSFSTVEDLSALMEQTNGLLLITDKLLYKRHYVVY